MHPSSLTNLKMLGNEKKCEAQASVVTQISQNVDVKAIKALILIKNELVYFIRVLLASSSYHSDKLTKAGLISHLIRL